MLMCFGRAPVEMVDGKWELCYDAKGEKISPNGDKRALVPVQTSENKP
jgi:hypothetical protein